MNLSKPQRIYYRIAGHLFCIEGEDVFFIQRYLLSAKPFMVEDIINEQPLFVLKIGENIPDWYHESLPDWHVETLYTFDGETDDCAFARYDNGYLFRMDSREENDSVLMIKENGSSVFYSNFSPYKKYAFSNLSFLLWVVYGLATVSLRSVSIHASTIFYNNKAVLFLGESGTGKSTHTRLWVKHIPGTNILNDDSPIVKIVNNQVYAFGSMWSGKLACYKNESYPIAAMVRIRQAAFNKIHHLDVIQALGAVFPSCPTLFAYDSLLSDFICNTISTIIESVPIYILDCLPEKESAFLSFTTIFKE